MPDMPATPAAAVAPAADPSKPAAATPRTTITDPTKPGTTSKMFPDLVGSDVRGAPKAPENAGATPPASPAPAAPATPPAAPPAAPADMIDLVALSGKKVALKVDGKEEVVTLEEALRRSQLDTSLTTRAQALAAKEHEVNEREKALRTQPAGSPPPAPAGTPDLSKSIIADDPAVKLLLQEVQDLKAKNQQLESLNAPAKMEANLRFLASEAERVLGAKDFLDFRDAMVTEFRALTPEQLKVSDNPQWWLNSYSRLKMKALAERVAAPAAPPLPTRPGAPMTGDPIAGGGAPTRAAVPETTAEQAAISAAFQQAQRSGDMEDWAYFERLSREAKEKRAAA